MTLALVKKGLVGKAVLEEPSRQPPPPPKEKKIVKNTSPGMNRDKRIIFFYYHHHSIHWVEYKKYTFMTSVSSSVIARKF